MKSKKYYKCQVCGFEAIKWQGKCPECSSWNSLKELTKIDADSTSQNNLNHSIAKFEKEVSPKSIATVLKEIKTQNDKRLYNFSTSILDNFFGKGLVAGSFILLAGEPGLGKSTLSLQLLRSLFLKNNKKEGSIKLLYITAEESVFELARRSQRLNIPKEIMVLQANNFEQIEKTLYDYKPDVVVVDSVQTIYSSQINSNPGSVSQVSTLASQLLAIAKSENISIILVGHVTKEGQIAGPKTLEHLVDAVLLLESSDSVNYRTLSFSKNRFGSTNTMLLMKMEEVGLEIVTDPSLALLENLENGVGICYGMAMDKDLPLMVEIQALVTNPNFGANTFGRRETIGFKNSKLNSILALAEKYLGLDFKSSDVYVKLSGLPKNIQDESLDLPVLLAILSSLYEKNLQAILKLDLNSKIVFAGRLTFSGNIRNATSHDSRINTAKQLGFNYNPKLDIGLISDSLKMFR